MAQFYRRNPIYGKNDKRRGVTRLLKTRKGILHLILQVLALFLLGINSLKQKQNHDAEKNNIFI